MNQLHTHYRLTAHLFAIKLVNLVKTYEAAAGGVRVF